jgi:hypothetical protein
MAATLFSVIVLVVTEHDFKRPQLGDVESGDALGIHSAEFFSVVFNFAPCVSSRVLQLKVSLLKIKNISTEVALKENGVVIIKIL